MYYKYVHGHVVQKFDINGNCVDQEFIGEHESWGLGALSRLRWWQTK